MSLGDAKDGAPPAADTSAVTLARVIAPATPIAVPAATTAPAGTPPPTRPGRGQPLLAPGTVLAGRYEIRAHLGAGGMGTVHAARDSLLDMPVALKFVRPELASHPGEQARLFREIRLAQAITHPNVVRTFTLDRHEEHLFIVMELLEGCSLSDRLRAGPLPLEDVQRVLRDVLTGLRAAHAKGIVHRDIKPQNTWLCSDGRAVLMDFGIARAAQAPAEASPTAAEFGTSLAGTPGYMAPEVLDGHSATMASDIYAVGVLLHEMLTGRPPQGHAGAGLSTVSSVMTGELPASVDPTRDLIGIPDRVAPVLGRMLAAEPQDRYPSAMAALTALDEVAPAASPPQPAASLRNRIGLGLGAALAVASMTWAVLRPALDAPPASPVVSSPSPPPSLSPSPSLSPPPSPSPSPPPVVAAPVPSPARRAKRPPRRPAPAPAPVNSAPPAVPREPQELTLGKAEADRLDLLKLGGNLRVIRPGFVLAILLALASPVLAEEDGTGTAERLIEEGRALFVRDADYAGALDRFRRAYALSPSWQALAGQGAVHQKRGSYVEALECYERLVREFADEISEAQVVRAREQIASLRTRVAVVLVIARQPGVRILIDGRDIGIAPLRTEVRLLPGPHTLMASGEPYEALARTFDVSAGDTVPMVVALAPAMMLVERTRLARRWPEWRPWLGMAAGAAIGAAGVLLRQSAAADVAAIDDDIRAMGGRVPVESDAGDALDSADRKNALALVLIAGGGAVLITGVVAAIENQPRPVVDQRRVPRLRVSPGGVALTVPF